MRNDIEKELTEADSAARDAQAFVCPSCSAQLAPGTRFCRMCGYRLGEGVEEYAETRYFDGTPPPMPPRPSASAPPKDKERFGSPFETPHAWGAVAPRPPASVESSVLKKLARSFGPSNLGWVFWVILSIVILTAGGVVIKTIKSVGSDDRNAVVALHRGFMGVDGFEDAPDRGGALIEGIAAPDTPVERAGLIGGDVIVNFDGTAIASDEDMSRALASTPPGKEVTIEFIRDGQRQTAKLIVSAERDYRGWEAVDARPGGKGQLGISDLERVRAPGQEIYGVRIGDVDRNEPADLAGIQEKDVVITFDGAPVRTAGDLRYRIYKAEPGSTVTVVVIRGTERVEIPVKIGRSR